MTEDEKDIQEFEEAFEKGRYSIRFSLVSQRADVISVIKDWMLEMWLTSRQSLRGEITRLQGIIDGYYILNGDLSLGATKLREENERLRADLNYVDFILNRRDALDNEPTRIDKILKAINTAKRVTQLEAEIDRLRGEAPDAGGKSLQRGKRHFSSMPE